MSDDPTKKRPAPRDSVRSRLPDEEPGRLAEDDRGNMTWQWANDDVLQADDTAGAIERLRALVDPRLGVIEDEAPNKLRSNPKGTKLGYNPYDSGTLGKTERKKKRSMQELSKWIEAKRKVEAKAKDEPGE
jgi:hypothetical protein